ncbi:lanthionine synthetase C family protein [Streptomyces scabiei]|uniref:lanthionine synthetase C family protein n=1 Tax=Streptomyces scabiei TaxID=1930 RepID=UPI0029BC70ED|nr:lanthionine synthetase C family protein [Streptomyces scabiei]MDX2531539.1 lanthionine synthetase C family protein [Streptomyces scabiei]MDX2796597.1 lanthionine synthetase C family protein [Streptomyces scabiei]MDX2856873.1 lanthionine synthetase C family protein [Streptomyces scabiei]MDX3824615.1 lanthionine synthetase C family protein [Streptomyces scabiei]
MITTAPAPTTLASVDHLADALADPDTAWPGGRPEGGRSWPQSLAGGASGIALLHIERARTGHGDWATARVWLKAAVQGEVSAAANANLYFGAPALAYVMHRAASASSRYLPVFDRLDSATLALTRNRLAAAHQRISRAERPLMEEFDLIRGLSGLGSYHLSRHPHHEITADVIAYLVRLTEPLPGPAGLPPWWTDVAPSGVLHPDYPGGHGNVGLAHGIGSTLAVLSQAVLGGLAVPGIASAIERICAWTDHWRQGDQTAPWWPGHLSMQQVTDHQVHSALRPRPSWCYGVGGTARAQQLAGLALGDPARVAMAETAILAALRDPLQLDTLPEPGLCHGMAGLLHAAWRMATETDNPEITAELPHLAHRLITALDQSDPDPELLDGTAGVALALHTVGTGRAPAPHWDTFLAMA